MNYLLSGMAFNLVCKAAGSKELQVVQIHLIHLIPSGIDWLCLNEKHFHFRFVLFMLPKHKMNPQKFLFFLSSLLVLQ